jgi:hypothetical protein
MKKRIASMALVAALAMVGYVKANTVEGQSGGAIVASFDITVTNSGTTVAGPLAGPYDGADDTAIDVFNNSSGVLPSINISSSLDIFGFDGDGISTYVAAPTGPTGYEGPGTSFANITGENFDGVDGFGQTAPVETGTVVFAGGLAPGATAYFSLEEDLASASGTPITVTTGTPLPAPALMGAVGILGLGLLKKYAPKFA